jgi:hypothetical protein
MRVFSTTLILSIAYTASAVAQQKPAERPPDLSLTAVGRQHHSIATKSQAAQDYFDQGLTFIYGFNHEEAERAFQQAAVLDPASPMPLWGIALAVGPNYNLDVDAEREKLAYETIQRASKLSEHAPQAERDYVSALAARYSGDAKPDYPKLASNYAAAMKALSQKYPDDLDAATFYADKSDGLKSLEALDTRRTAHGKHGRNRPRSRICSSARSQSRRRESLLHSCRRGLAASGARFAERPAPRHHGSASGAPGAHARAHLPAHGRLCRRRKTK